jgi:2,3-bisphosphoglycerate-independent phosphoglycerate mutase
VDACLARVIDAVHGSGGACIVTADHGNAEQMLTEAGLPQTAHTLGPVPVIVTCRGVRLAADGILANIAPTVLGLLGMEQPAAMSAKSLLL